MGMGLLNWIAGWSTDHRIEDWAETVAARSLDAVWQDVAERAAMLGGNTLRGYIRARGGAAIRAELARVEQFVGPMSDDARRRVTERALDELTQRIMLRAVAAVRTVRQRRAA